MARVTAIPTYLCSVAIATLRRRMIMAMVTCLLFACGRVAAQESGDVFVSNQPITVTYEELLAREQHARSDRITASEKFHELTQIAHDYYRLGDFGKSLSLFQEVSGSADADDGSRVDSARMVGQIYLFAKNDPAKAEGAYSEMLKLTESSQSPNVVHSKGQLLGEGYEKLAIAYQAQQQFDKSTGARKEMLAKGILSPERMAIGILENARDYLKAKDFTESLASYDLLEKQFPDYGRDDGRIVNIQLERIEAYGLDRNDPKRIELLSSIWQDQRNMKYPQSLNVGREIVGLADFLGKGDVVVALANEWLQRYESEFHDLPLEIKKSVNIDIAYGQVVITLATWLEGEGDYITPIALYERFLRAFPGSMFSDYARKTLDRLYKDKLGYAPEDRIADDIESQGMGTSSSSQSSSAPRRRHLGAESITRNEHTQEPESPATRSGSRKLWIVLSVVVGIVAVAFIALRLHRGRQRRP